MAPAEARANLLAAEGDEDPLTLPAAVLHHLTARDIPDGVSIQIGTLKDKVIHLEWEGHLYRDGESVTGEAEYIWTRKYWYSPLGLEQYMDLVRRAVETRHRIHGDVELTHWDDDGAYIQLQFAITTGESNVGRAFEAVRMVVAQVEEAAEQAADEVGKRIAEVAARLSGWGAESLEQLVNKVETAQSTDDKGRSLEELCSRLLQTIDGFAITGRLRTATEEIDISIVNGSIEPRLRRESAVILA